MGKNAIKDGLKLEMFIPKAHLTTHTNLGILISLAADFYICPLPVLLVRPESK